jgi:hypothetical protein
MRSDRINLNQKSITPISTERLHAHEISLNPRKAEKLHCFGNVSRNAAITTITFIVTPSNRILPKAAARRLALPTQRKRSRIIQGHTIDSSVAAAECALAARAAHR